MFKQRQVGDDPFGGAQDKEVEKAKPLLGEVPDIHETMRLLGEKDLVLTETKTQAKDPKAPKAKDRRLLCCCGRSGCRIGPMTLTEEVP